MPDKEHDKKPETDKALFREQLKDTRPIDSPRIDPRGQPPSPKPRFSGIQIREPATKGVVIYGQTPGYSAEEYISYAAAGPQKKLLRKLRQGLLIREAVIDLHRQTLRDAAQTVHDFLHEAVAARLRCVLIIHGKGSRSKADTPKMKNQLALWLRHHDDVLAYCSALPDDGGTGALYVLVRRR
ncbi:MAG: Smr/MutS family protein [Gammaproteobacteria bacterium]